jgi:hypothetical protein
MNHAGDHEPVLTALLNSKWLSVSGFGAATATLSADKIAASAPQLPAAINWIGTHGPTAWFSWADCMAAGSALLIALNLLSFAVKGVRWVKKTWRRRG